MGNPTFTVAGLFAGIGGIELGFQRALGNEVDTAMLCEWWEPAKTVLGARFPGVEIHPDVRDLRDLPAAANLVTAGFPCTDLSQAGRMAGIDGVNSGLIKHVFEVLRLVKQTRTLPTLLIENVPNMLALNHGKAMAFLVAELEDLGYRWAYRVVDSRFTGVPQRRRRVLLVASVDLDPRAVLFADDEGPLESGELSDEAFGFYWTEGRGGLGWAQDAVPTLKGGSTIGIPSPPAVWLPAAELGRRLIKPTVEDAEAMQGFDRGWTNVGGVATKRNGPRWKLVGNAVTVGVARWVAGRLANPGTPLDVSMEWTPGKGTWPTAAWGEHGKVWNASTLTEYPTKDAYKHLIDELDLATAEPLTHRGASGFLGRLQQGNLGRHPGFREDVAAHVDAVSGA